MWGRRAGLYELDGTIESTRFTLLSGKYYDYFPYLEKSTNLSSFCAAVFHTQQPGMED